MRIGELADMLGTTTKTLRFYEQIGLLEHPDRTRSGYRLYGTDEIRKARLLVGLRRIGLTIDELQQLKNDKQESSFRKRLSSVMDQKLFQIDQDLGLLQGKREDLAARLQALVSTPRERTPDCICDALLTRCSCGTVPEKNTD
jgi:DNA-binding transcriptional MerR regulator